MSEISKFRFDIGASFGIYYSVICFGVTLFEIILNKDYTWGVFLLLLVSIFLIYVFTNLKSFILEQQKK